MNEKPPRVGVFIIRTLYYLSCTNHGKIIGLTKSTTEPNHKPTCISVVLRFSLFFLFVHVHIDLWLDWSTAI